MANYPYGCSSKSVSVGLVCGLGLMTFVSVIHSAAEASYMACSTIK